MKQLLSALVLSLIFISGALGSLGNLTGGWLSLSAAEAAPGEGYCVIPPTATPGTYAACTQVFTNIQVAVDAAVGGEQILVATGHYTALQARTTITQVVYLSKTLQLLGGFNDDFSLRDPIAYPTILDAQARGRVFYLTGPISVTIEGFEITGGNATGLGGGKYYSTSEAGGALYLDGSTLILRHNRIHHNQVSDRNTTNDLLFAMGGGLYLADGTALVADNLIDHNTAVAASTELSNSGIGGGIYIYQTEAVVRDNTIHSNIANNGSGGEGTGGGIFIMSSTVTLTNNQLHSNVACFASPAPAPIPGCALTSAGGLGSLWSTTTLDHNQVLSNTAAGSTANYVLGGGLGFYSGQVTVTHNLIRGNTGAVSTTIYAYGGGLYSEHNQPAYFANNVIQDNVADRAGTAGWGGGMFAADYDPPHGPLVFQDNLIQGNIASLSGDGIGGGLYLYGLASPINSTLVHNQILSNSATAAQGSTSLGGGAVLESSETRLQDNLFQNNVAQDYGGGLLIRDSQTRLANTAFVANQAGLGGAGLMIEDGSTVHALHTTLNDQGQTGSDISIVDDPNSGGHGRFNTVWLTNTIQASHTLGIRVTTGNTLTVNSILWSQTPITISADLSTTIQVSNSHSGDPAFTADGYHLTVGSDAFGQGIPTDVATDIDGESRRPVPDLGADEFQLSLPLHRFHLPLIIKTPQGGFSLVD